MSKPTIPEFRPIKFAIAMITVTFSIAYFGWAVLIPLVIVGTDIKLR